MSLNIGPMLRAMLGEAAPAESRALELRIGQIVRGVLLEMLDDGEALMNIAGVHVRAKLETDLPVGGGTLLQVQPGSNGATVVLKPLADPSDGLPDEGLKKGLKSFGLPDQKWSQELIRGLRRDGYPIGKETASYFQTAAGMKPAGTDAASWMAAADVAFRRGLAPSEDTLGSLRQALFGLPLHEELNGLASALKEWLSGIPAKSALAGDLAVRLQALLVEGETLLSQGEAHLLGGDEVQTAVHPEKSSAADAGDPRSAIANTAGKVDPNAPSRAGPFAGQAVSAEIADAEQTPDSVNPVPIEDSADMASKGISVGTQEQGKTSRHKAAGSAAASRPAETIIPAAWAQHSAGDTEDAAAAAAKPAVPRGESAWIGRFLQWLGAGHEHRLLNETAAEGRWSSHSSFPDIGGLPGAEDRQGAVPSRAGTADTLKSVLLSLAAHEETPPVLREAAHSLVNQITGQQLLLSSERQPNQPFSLMTLFVPMKGQDGDTTATVHIQTRRSRRGEWDTDNCRLLFDLRMRHLGDTVVDVQVVERIVSVKLMNDFPGMAALAQQAKDQLNTALKDAGFQLLSLTAAPLPRPAEPIAAEDRDGSGSGRPDVPLSSAYASKPYRGVDYRA